MQKFFFQSSGKQHIQILVNRKSYGTFYLNKGMNEILTDLNEYQPDNMITFFCFENLTTNLKLKNIILWGLDISELGKKDDLGCKLLCTTQCFDNTNSLMPSLPGNELISSNGTISIKYSWPVDIWFFEQLQWIRNSETLKF